MVIVKAATTTNVHDIESFIHPLSISRLFPSFFAISL